MEPNSISVARSLPIDSALVGDVLLRLRRDAPGAIVRWTLGDRGRAEIDVTFTSAGTQWSTDARVWDAAGLGVAGVTIVIAEAAADEITVELRPQTLTTWWESRVPQLLDLARAVVDELAEELLWHAARAGVTG